MGWRIQFHSKLQLSPPLSPPDQQHPTKLVNDSPRSERWFVALVTLVSRSKGLWAIDDCEAPGSQRMTTTRSLSLFG